MVKFMCAKCNYRFESEKADNCPYCGEESIEEEKSASEIIDDVTNILEED